MADLAVVGDQPEPLAEWLEPSLQDTAGQDPLGFNTITLDRILPQLIPGILQLSERARYFSIYPWMLLQFARRKRPATGVEIDLFIRRREYELCLAMKLCRRCGASRAIGSKSAGPKVTAGEDPFVRSVSVESHKGGFGLYYRSPLVALGAVAAPGTPIGPDGDVTPIEVLHEDDRVLAAAEAFHRSIEGTEYYARYERSEEPIPRVVLEELAAHVCLCRLPELDEEREAVRAVMFTPGSERDAEACEARRRAFALYLLLLGGNPAVAHANGEFWRSAIDLFASDPKADTVTGRTVAAWAAVAMKECVQDAICSIWTDFCRSGWHEQGLEGLSRDELRMMIRKLAGRDGLALNEIGLNVSPDEPAATVSDRAVAAAAEMDWEDVRSWAAEGDNAAAGIVALLVFADRLPDPISVHPLWGEIAARRTDHQDGLLSAISLLRDRLQGGLTFGELLDWTVRRFVIGPHEAIAYSKLPRSTFRFSWDEGGRLRFFMPGTGGLDRFEPSDDRRTPMTSLTEDVGLWREQDGVPQLTAAGGAFVKEILG